MFKIEYFYEWRLSMFVCRMLEIPSKIDRYKKDTIFQGSNGRKIVSAYCPDSKRDVLFIWGSAPDSDRRMYDGTLIKEDLKLLNEYCIKNKERLVLKF